jgi:hypothetical protein
MANCFSNVIGIKENCTAGTGYKLFINQLGINLKLLDQYAGSNYQHGLDLFNEKLEFAGQAMASEMIVSLSKRIRGNTLISNVAVGYFSDPTATVLAIGAGTWVGVRIKQDTPSFIALTLKDIKLNLITTGSIPLKIFNYQTKVLIADVTVTANDWSALNEVVRSIGRDIDIVVGYESIYAAKRTLISRGACNGNCPPTFISCGNYTDVVGVKFALDKSALGAVVNLGHTSGVELNYNVSCNYLSWLCSISQLTALPLLYKVAAEITEYAIHFSPNERVNNSVEERDNLKSQYDFFTQKYNEALGNVLQNMKLPIGDDCFVCRENVRYTVQLP